MNLALGSNFTEQGLAIALNTFNFPEDYCFSQRHLSRGLRFLFAHIRKTKFTPRQLEERALFLFNRFLRDSYVEGVREMADIIAEYCPTHRENILQRLRDIDALAVNRINNNRNERVRDETLRNRRRRIDNKEKTVYSDSQNVHASNINNSVCKAISALYNQFKEIIGDDRNNKINMTVEIQKYLSEKYPLNTELIESSIIYINESTATFTTALIGMIDCFLSIWLWIINNEHHDELEKRLIEEFKEMNGQCSTGHVSRLINTIQGFTTDPNLQIQISDKDQYSSVIKTFLTTKLQECTDEKIHEEMVTGGSGFVNFIKKIVSIQLPIWKKEYGEDIESHIYYIVNEYTTFEIYDIKTRYKI
jgi:hypothetical protein